MKKVSICIGSSCHIKGSYNVIQTFRQMSEENGLGDQIELKATFCMKHCQNVVSVCVDDEYYSVSPETARKFFEEHIMA